MRLGKAVAASALRGFKGINVETPSDSGSDPSCSAHVVPGCAEHAQPSRRITPLPHPPPGTDSHPSSSPLTNPPPQISQPPSFSMLVSQQQEATTAALPHFLL
ncbi:unnamed protein product [Pleuronectes platessa]|uniref:Uncharacterized protein n=1 Tax=Pleuronectes platessa TaxID=8262 RepID=A0A9N7UTM1_PLEPL|nr:unnamed protein product [Pleuronectes platessa]